MVLRQEDTFKVRFHCEYRTLTTALASSEILLMILSGTEQLLK